MENSFKWVYIYTHKQDSVSATITSPMLNHRIKETLSFIELWCQQIILQYA